jgi:hypothetical protein
VEVVDLSKLPPYEPDGTLPPLPEEGVDGEWLRRRYRLSKAAFHNRKNALPSVKGFKHARRVLFTPQEVYLFDACDWYLGQGYTLEDVANAQEDYLEANSGVEDTEEVFEQLETPTPAPNTSTTSLSLSPQVDKLGRDLAAVVARAVEQLAPRPETDPLRTLRLLDEASEKDYILTTRWLAESLGYSERTVQGFKSPVVKHGFRLERLAAGKWTVKRLSKEEQAEHLKETRTYNSNNFKSISKV